MTYTVAYLISVRNDIRTRTFSVLVHVPLNNVHTHTHNHGFTYYHICLTITVEEQATINTIVHLHKYFSITLRDIEKN